MPDQSSSIISKVWGMCGPLRDDGSITQSGGGSLTDFPIDPK